MDSNKQTLKDDFSESLEREASFLSTDEQLALFEYVFKKSDMPQAVCDSSGALLFKNDAFTSSLAAAEIKHLTDRRLGLPIDATITLLSTCMETGQPGTISFHDPNTGLSRDLRASPVPKIPEKILIQLTTADTQSTQLDLVKSLQHIKVGAVILGEQSEIQYIDERVANWHLSKPAESLNRTFSSLLHPEHRASFDEALGNAESNPVDIEVPMLRKDGESTWVRIRSLSEDPSSQTILLIENIRLRKQDEKQSKITQKLELLGQITGGVAHDFNNILAIIIGYIDLMSGEVDTLKPSDAERYLGQMKDASERARNLVKQLLLYSRGDKRNTVTKQNVAQGVNETLPLVRTSLQEHIYLTTNITAEDAYIEMDPAHLHQILMNLCINARDAVDEVNDREGEIIIGVNYVAHGEDIDCASCQAKILTEEQERFVILSVTDNGPGLAVGAIEHMFDPFFTTKSANKGSGMGLSVVHGLVHQYGGHLQVLNSNHGVQFRIWLPTAVPEQRPSNVQTIGAGNQAQFNWRVLVVEDDVDVAAVLTKLLAYLHIQVEHCQNGMEAIEQLKVDKDFDLVISDHSMPVMTGIELAAACQELIPNLPIIMLSGNSLDFDGEHLPPNVLHVLDKPITSRELTEAIQKVADREPQIPDLGAETKIH